MADSGSPKRRAESPPPEEPPAQRPAASTKRYFYVPAVEFDAEIKARHAWGMKKGMAVDVNPDWVWRVQHSPTSYQESLIVEWIRARTLRPPLLETKTFDDRVACLPPEKLLLMSFQVRAHHNVQYVEASHDNHRQSGESVLHHVGRTPLGCDWSVHLALRENLCMGREPGLVSLSETLRRRRRRGRRRGRRGRWRRRRGRRWRWRWRWGRRRGRRRRQECRAIRRPAVSTLHKHPVARASWIESPIGTSSVVRAAHSWLTLRVRGAIDWTRIRDSTACLTGEHCSALAADHWPEWATAEEETAVGSHVRRRRRRAMPLPAPIASRCSSGRSRSCTQGAANTMST